MTQRASSLNENRPTSSIKKEFLLIQISLSAVMAALVSVATLIIRVPNPMGGYFNFGDVMIFVSALTFGPIIGGIAGGIGSAIADMLGFPVFVIPTLIIKGLEGFLAGLIADRKSVFRDILAVVVAGSEMIVGYFLVELYPLQWGLGGALAEVPPNIAQIVIGGLVGIPVAKIVRRRLPEVFNFKSQSLNYNTTKLRKARCKSGFSQKSNSTTSSILGCSSTRIYSPTGSII